MLDRRFLNALNARKALPSRALRPRVPPVGSAFSGDMAFRSGDLGGLYRPAKPLTRSGNDTYLSAGPQFVGHAWVASRPETGWNACLLAHHQGKVRQGDPAVTSLGPVSRSRGFATASPDLATTSAPLGTRSGQSAATSRKPIARSRDLRRCLQIPSRLRLISGRHPGIRGDIPGTHRSIQGSVATSSDLVTTSAHLEATSVDPPRHPGNPRLDPGSCGDIYRSRRDFGSSQDVIRGSAAASRESTARSKDLRQHLQV
jgi:hypothetical protein